MAEPEYATVTISGSDDYRNGAYRSAEIDIDISDPGQPIPAGLAGCGRPAG
jgi:hypothetical protein